MAESHQPENLTHVFFSTFTIRQMIFSPIHDSWNDYFTKKVNNKIVLGLTLQGLSSRPNFAGLIIWA